MGEVFNLEHGWLADVPPREQVLEQKMIEDRFYWHLTRMRDLGLEISPIRRSMRTDKIEGINRSFNMITYRQRVTVHGSEEAIERAKSLIKEG